MKTISFKFIIAAMVAVATMLVSPSCRKETVGGAAGNVADGVRVISVQFDNSTKAVLGSDGLTPKFENNDRIRVSNATGSEECIINVSGGIATFTTNLDGELTAIYPADAAVLSSSEADAPIAPSNSFKVSAVQDGTARNAMIAMATIAAGASSAFFTGVTSLFEITPPSGATSITITSTAEDINTDGATPADKLVIKAPVLSDGKSYVSLVPGVKLSKLLF
ncbi:MAG: hypothetical protein KBS73_04270, partial [Bacteroidales bacterium]|nr:hypothetical protein [Candidatus Cacconaster equifaecalis]